MARSAACPAPSPGASADVADTDLPLVTEGPFAGWRSWSGRDPWETLTGPFYFRREGEAVRCAFRVEAKHLNGLGVIHGGCLMTFADFALFAIAHPLIGTGPAVTVSLHGDFIAAGREGELVEATGEVTRASRSLVFVRGLLTAGERTLFGFSGIIRRLSGP
ncbi:PaaI family thioesterase [Rhodocista pekingensis]|uniref:PaaI family thioesterase n=1 Tax=Rhodocista pekingensis TaxID=201185 RepID=A0ABW2L2G5_9PROT